MDERHLSRRRLLGTVGATGAAGVALGATGGALVAHAQDGEPATELASVGATRVPFHGRRQSGITTPQQAYAHLAAFDLKPGTGRRQAAALMRRWSRTAAELMAGREPEGDSGVARDAGPCSLSVTFGFGRSFFGRTGLKAQLPRQLAPLPEFSMDQLDRDRSEGDLWVQIGAMDGLVAFHALRVLQRQAAGYAGLRWQMSGFHRSPGATAQPMTGRNLMGQVDGTNNPKPEEKDFDRRIFVPSDGQPSWMAQGSYAVFRRIHMLLDDWEKKPLAAQERVIGRRKSDGAPLSGGEEDTEVDLDKRVDGELVIAANAHVRVTAPESNGGAAMLRRSFSYHDGFRSDGSPDAGLLFVAWQADPLKGFVPVQRKLDRGDALSPFIRHEASGLFAVPGGAASGEYVGQALLEG
ncbi:iron uptake transporter deferrochelatase/peroxidase subunit [Streptomyces sp. NPDC005438]|uniref:iron uptake transporter deferrochelatase/peroxidase subunit n=1 Tax=Streptomyces sp. NPDC005438 TaxID=3156880 RepID=UPI0033AADBAE